MKIEPKGHLVAETNYGDIDNLAYNPNEKIIYSIECKDTKQVKTIYEFQRDLRNYRDKQIPKHIRRHLWLEENFNSLGKFLDNEEEKFELKSYLISSHPLPVKLFFSHKIDYLSFTELRKKRCL